MTQIESKINLMKKIILLFLILLTKLILAEDTTKVIIGYDYVSKSNIYGDVSRMPKDFHKIFVDTINNNLYALYKTKDIVVKNQVVCYDLITLKEKWSRLFEHQNVIFYHDKLFYFTFTKAYKINPNTGKDMWIKDERITIVNKKLDYGLRISKSKTPKRMKLIGVNLENSNDIWEKEVPETVVNSIHSHEDDILMNISGLLKLNINDGNGWYFEAENSIKHNEIKKTNIFNSQNEYHGISSNLIIDSNYYYQAFKKSLVCLDKNGNMIWQTEIPSRNHTGYSLTQLGPSIYLIGLGRSNSQNVLVNNNIKINSPFIAAYDKTNGQNIFFIDSIPISKKESIINFINVDSLFYFRTKNNLILFNINSKALKVESEYNKGLFYKVQGFLPNNTFMELDSSIVSTSISNQKGLIMFAFESENELLFNPYNNFDKVKFYQVNENLKVVKEIIRPKIFLEYYLNNDNNIHYLLSSNESTNNEIIQINKDLSIIKRFYFNAVPFHFNGSFYTFNQNNLIIGKSSDYTE